MGIAIHLAGKYSLSGLLPIPESPEKWLERVRAAARRHAKVALTHDEIGRNGDGTSFLALDLHPAAESLVFLVHRRGSFQVHAKTSTVGPGYHIYLCDLLHAIEDELEIRWNQPEPDGTPGDETGYFHDGDPSDVFRAMTGWLGATARKIAELRDSGTDGGPFSLSLPSEHTYEFEEILTTPLGPRDSDWLTGAALDANRGIDVFPWWHRGTGAAHLLGRALVRMWLDVRWRPPLWDEEEKAAREAVDCLAQAYKMDPGLSYPFHEWAELVTHLGVDREAVEPLRARASEAPDRSPIGYRRRDVTARLTGGWSLRLPGSFAERWDPESPGRFTAWEDGRSVHFTSYSFADEVESERALGFTDEMPGERFDHKDGPLSSRAHLREVSGDGEPYWSLIAAAASGRGVAVVTTSFHAVEHRDWALAIWRSLRHQEEPELEHHDGSDEE